MKTLLSVAAASVQACFAGAAWAQNGSMMNGVMNGGGWMGGYGGYWMPVLLLVVVGLIVWVVMQGRKK